MKKKTKNILIGVVAFTVIAAIANSNNSESKSSESNSSSLVAEEPPLVSYSADVGKLMMDKAGNTIGVGNGNYKTERIGFHRHHRPCGSQLGLGFTTV